jgi:small GTP-binding protein
VKANRAILLTAPGAAAIAVARLVGPGVREFLAKHFSREPMVGRCVHGTLRDGEEIIDDPVVALGEGFADVNLHGGTWVIAAMLELARREGFEIVEASLPLAEEAVDGSSVIEREMLAHLPLARTREAIEILLAQPAAWENLRTEDAAAVLVDESLWWLLHPPRVAIVGAPNVGKSTLANQLFGQQRSITADAPGTTRDWVGEIANIDGLAVTLVDTPGLRETRDAVEAEAILKSHEQVSAAELRIRVHDSSASDVAEIGSNEILVLNKWDRAEPSAWQNVNGIRTIATTGEGLDVLRLQIRERFGCENLDPRRPRWWTERQRDALQRMMS